MAGLTAAHRLQEQCDVIVLDKGRGVGGRLATRRIGDATIDHGAQFITTHTAEFAEMVERLVGESVVAPWFRGRVLWERDGRCEIIDARLPAAQVRMHRVRRRVLEIHRRHLRHEPRHHLLGGLLKLAAELGDEHALHLGS